MSRPSFDRAALSIRVTELFRSQVTDGHWPLGSRIPTESELVEWSGAGRNTVREAIGSLVQAGILRREQGRGTFVVSTSDLRSSVSRRVAATSRRDSLELRLALDAAAARIAAVRRTDADTDAANTTFQQAQETLLTDLPALPLWYANVTGGYGEGVSNVEFGWNSVPLYYEITKN